MVYRRLNCESCLDVLCCRCCSRPGRACCPCLIPKSAPEAGRMMTFGGFLAFVACLFVGIGFLVPALLDRSLDRALHQLKALDSTDSRAYAMFSDNHEYPIRIAIYAVNCTNPEEVVATGAAPHFQEVGPFVYYMYRRAMNVSWTDDATTLTWRYNTRYMFALEESVASDDTMLYIPNIVFWGMASSLRESSPGMLVVIANAAKMSELDMAFAHRPLHEHIFGYSRESDPMLKFLSKDHEGLIKNHTDEADALKKAKLDTITTGYPDIRSLHQYVKYQEQEILRNADGSDWAWADKEAGRVHGSDGGAFPLPIDRAASPHIFVSSYYRSVQLDYIEDRDVKGIKLLRFNVPQKMWESAEKNPDNAKYDQEWDGLLNLRHPMAKVPFYLSRPRLHKADPRSQEHMTVDWLEPADKRHDSDYETYFDVEPTMGASMSIVTTSQLNLQMQGFTVQYEDDDQPVEKTFFANMKTPFLAPIFWANQTVLISDKDAHDFKGSVYGVFRIISVTPIVCYSIAGTIALIALLIALRGYKYHQLYRFEGHVFVETDNVDGNFASDDVLAAHEHRRFRRGKPGRADGGGRGDLEGVGLDSLAAHSAAHNGVAYGSTERRVSPPLPAPVAALGGNARQSNVLNNAAAIASGGGMGRGAVFTDALSSPTPSAATGAGDDRNNDDEELLRSPSGYVDDRSVAVDAPEADAPVAGGRNKGGRGRRR